MGRSDIEARINQELLSTFTRTTRTPPEPGSDSDWAYAPPEPEQQLNTEGPQIRGIYSGANANVSVAGFARNKNYVLTFTHVGTGHKVSFPAIIDSFSDTHTPVANTKVFAGTPNPTITQGSTGREISFSFKVLSASLEEARYNTQSINMLLQMMYARLDSQDGRALIDPFIRISGFNLLRDGGGSTSTKVFIQNITYSLDPDEGFIMSKERPEGELHPISTTISISATALIPDDTSEDRNQPYPSDYPRYR